MPRRTYAQRIPIPLEGDPATCFYSKDGLLLAKGYKRIVIGQRGPYIEFDDDQIIKDNISIPKHAEHKLKNSMSYYWEYRSNDRSFVKLYWQKMTVLYADYKVGLWYISPSEVKTDEFAKLLLPRYYEVEVPVEVPKEIPETKGTLFDDLK